MRNIQRGTALEYFIYLVSYAILLLLQNCDVETTPARVTTKDQIYFQTLRKPQGARHDLASSPVAAEKLHECFCSGTVTCRRNYLISLTLIFWLLSYKKSCVPSDRELFSHGMLAKNNILAVRQVNKILMMPPRILRRKNNSTVSIYIIFCCAEFVIDELIILSSLCAGLKNHPVSALIVYIFLFSTEGSEHRKRQVRNPRSPDAGHSIWIYLLYIARLLDPPLIIHFIF